MDEWTKDSLTAETRAGAVRGVRVGGCVVFRAVPFAASTAGSGRLSPPREPERWGGVREATVPGLAPPQPTGGLGVAIPGDPVGQSEDCLTLDLFTPSCDDEARPVMVFLHGGGFVGGSAHSQLYDGSSLARRGVVVVAVSYRLGVLGWLAHPSLGSEDFSGCGNWGLADQLAALEWVRDNIRSFGGDPDQVTLFGESAGSMCLAALLATPLAGRLFHRAILQSGPAVAISLEEASAVTEELARDLSLPEVSRQGLRAQPLEAVLAAQTGLRQRRAAGGLVFQPVVDGGLLSAHPESSIAAGSARRVDLLIGTNRDEWRFWSLFDASLARLDERQLVELVHTQLERVGCETVTADEVIETFRAARRERGEGTSPSEIYAAIATDWSFRVPSVRLAAAAAATGARVFSYLFEWPSPFLGGRLGACHALELPFVFGTWEIPAVSVFTGGGGQARRLSEAMQSAWVAFARSGDPSCPAVGSWPLFSVRRETMRLGGTVAPIEDPFEEERAILDQALGPFGRAARLPGSSGRSLSKDRTTVVDQGDVAQRQRQGA